jgi:hypothetical protein
MGSLSLQSLIIWIKSPQQYIFIVFLFCKSQQNEGTPTALATHPHQYRMANRVANATHFAFLRDAAGVVVLVRRTRRLGGNRCC